MILRRFQNMRQSHKLMLSFGLLVGIVLILILILYGIVLDKMKTVAIEANETAHNLAQNRLEQRIDEFENISSDFRNNTDLMWLLNRERSFDGETITRAMRLRESLPGISVTNSDLVGYYIYSPINDFVMSNVRTSMRVNLYYEDMYAVDGMDYAEWRAMMHNPSDEAFFLPSQNTKWDGVRTDCLFLVTPVYASSTSAIVGRVVFMLRESAIMNFFVEGLENRASYVCLMDGNGTVVVQAGDAGLFSQLENPVLLADGTLSATLGGRDVIVLKSTSDKGFSCLSIIEMSAISAELRDVRSILFSGIAVLLLVSILLSLLLTHQNTRSLKDMLEKLSSIGYRFENADEFKQLNDLILGQHSANEDQQKELARRRRWSQSVLFERMLDSRKVDPLMLTELESRLPCEGAVCVFLDLHTGDNQTGAYATQQRLVASLDAAYARVPFYRILSETCIQMVYRCCAEIRVSDFLRSLTGIAAVEGVHILCFVGPEVNSYTELPVSARNAQRGVMLHDPADGSDVILCERMPEVDIEALYTLETEHQLKLYCLQGNGAEAEQLLHRIRHAVNQNGVASQLTTQMLVTSLCNTMLKILNDLPGNLDPDQMDKIMCGMMEVMHNQSLGDLFHFASGCVEVFAEHASQFKRDNLAHRVDEINAYVHETYADPNLCLTLIAEHFNLTERYLSEFYKKNTGVNLSAYIEDVRMKKAQELLKDNAHVGEVAVHVGYMNVNTFRRAYRRQFGINPSDEMK